MANTRAYLLCCQRETRLTVRNLDTLWFFQRKSAAEIQDALTEIILTRSQPGFSQIVEDAYSAYVWCTAKVSAVLMTDEQYPERAARLIFRRLEQGEATTEESLQALLKEAQHPEQLDKVKQIAADLEETRLILLDNIEKVLARGEKLETLMAQSSQLSESSRAFYLKARKLNRCCTIS